jgi:hypothetical protein
MNISSIREFLIAKDQADHAAWLRDRERTDQALAFMNLLHGSLQRGKRP